jgi:acylphosphatase
MESMVRAHAIVIGRVQGVFFRMETQSAAERIGVSGWVRNKRDGSVEAVFEGKETKVATILEWCKKGPPHARVDRLDVVWEDYTGEFDAFEITY